VQVIAPFLFDNAVNLQLNGSTAQFATAARQFSEKAIVTGFAAKFLQSASLFFLQKRSAVAAAYHTAAVYPGGVERLCRLLRE
jgi:hypothetical protein